jgi:hypothetical protein
MGDALLGVALFFAGFLCGAAGAIAFVVWGLFFGRRRPIHVGARRGDSPGVQVLPWPDELKQGVDQVSHK